MNKRVRNIKLEITYDGTDFCGWQVQKNARTVQGAIEEALSVIHKDRVTLHYAGRTDSGVHAIGQVANFYSGVDTIPAEKYVPALNRLLPDDITIVSSRQVDDDFHARYSATNRIYRYYLHPSRYCSSVQARFCYPLGRDVNVQRMNDLASVLIGKHDFSSFATETDDEMSTVRLITNSYFFAKGPYIVYHIAGNGFLRKMVRAIVGTILELERQDADGRELKTILQAKSRSEAGETAPSKGLFLHRVEYDGRTA